MANKLTKSHLSELVSEKFNKTSAESVDLVDSFFDVMYQSLLDGYDIKISRFGNFILNDKKSRVGRNPRTKEEVEVVARRVVTFRLGDSLRTEIKQK